MNPKFDHTPYVYITEVRSCKVCFFNPFLSYRRKLSGVRLDPPPPGKGRVKEYLNSDVIFLVGGISRLATQDLVVAPMTFMMTQQRTRTICKNTKYLSFHWIRGSIQIELIIVRSNFQVNISEKFTFRDCSRPSFEESVNIDF